MRYRLWLRGQYVCVVAQQSHRWHEVACGSMIVVCRQCYIGRIRVFIRPWTQQSTERRDSASSALLSSRVAALTASQQEQLANNRILLRLAACRCRAMSRQLCRSTSDETEAQTRVYMFIYSLFTRI